MVSYHTAPNYTAVGKIPNFQCANSFVSLLAISLNQFAALFLELLFLYFLLTYKTLNFYILSKIISIKFYHINQTTFVIYFIVHFKTKFISHIIIPNTYYSGVYKSKLFGFNKNSSKLIIKIPCSFLQRFISSLTIIIFLKLSFILTKDFCSCSIFSLFGIAKAD